MHEKLSLQFIKSIDRKERKIILENEEECEYKKNLFFIKKDDVLFCNKVDGKLSAVDWKLYGETYNIYEKIKCNPNFGLELNKFTNIFNKREIEITDTKEKKYILEKIKENYEEIYKNLNNVYEFIPLFQGTIVDKLIVGFGGHTILNTDITLHHTYGVPYIPGQALKGVLKTHIIKEYFDGEECKANKDEVFLWIFGNEQEHRSGNVIFMDVFPVGRFSIRKDIMTPHHLKASEESDGLPLDTDEITPIEFLVVEDTTFEFNIAIKKRYSNKGDTEWCKDKHIMTVIIENLIEALNVHGIGAKTSVGYGYLHINRETINRKINQYIKECEILMQKKNEEKIFQEETKDMTQIEIDIYKAEKENDPVKRNELFMKIFNEKIDKIPEEEQKILATYIKEHLQKNKRWKINNKKKSKDQPRIKKICDILNIEIE